MNDIFKDMRANVGCEYISDQPSYKRKVWHESHWGQVKWTFYCHRGLVHKIFTKKLALNS